MVHDVDTIVAATTPKGRGGVAIVRVSGPNVRDCVKHWWPAMALKPRAMRYGKITDLEGVVIDEGLWVYFKGPHSYTGEDVLEFHGHGNPVLVDVIVQACCQLGCRMAMPGEFTQRAFLNERMDLTQAEAVADLIASESRHTAAMAMASLQGVFSDYIQRLADQLMHVRMMLEASLDFSDEDLDGMLPQSIETLFAEVMASVAALKKRVRVGVRCQEGCRMALVGPPNVGKSSLFNALSGMEQAIVTPYAGTTRDLLQTSVQLFGATLTLMDTAGLRQTDECIEQEGISRAQKAANDVEHVVLVLDGTLHDEADAKAFCQQFLAMDLSDKRIHLLLNKSDLMTKQPHWLASYQGHVVSAKTHEGLLAWAEQFSLQFLQQEGYEEDAFLARRRHLVLLDAVDQSLQEAHQRWQSHRALELLAEDLRHSHEQLGQMTGQVTSDDVLGAIFSQFCIGK